MTLGRRGRCATVAVVAILGLLIAMAAPAAELRFTLPATRAGADGCTPGTVPLDSLALVELWRLDSTLTLERARAPLGSPGDEETLHVEPGEGQVTYHVVTRAPGSRPSCPSNGVTFNGRVDVGPTGDPGAGPWLGVPRPNPTGGLVAVSWCLPAAAGMRLEVVDVAGRVVARPADGHHAAGVHVSLWDARRAAPGIYFVRARSGRWSAVARVLVLH